MSREFDGTDPLTAAVLLAVGGFGVESEQQVAALSSAIEVLRAANELEAQLEESGEYAITSTTMMKVRDRKRNATTD